jgi:hypothetical protein
VVREYVDHFNISHKSSFTEYVLKQLRKTDVTSRAGFKREQHKYNPWILMRHCFSKIMKS